MSNEFRLYFQCDLFSCRDFWIVLTALSASRKCWLVPVHAPVKIGKFKVTLVTKFPLVSSLKSCVRPRHICFIIYILSSCVWTVRAGMWNVSSPRRPVRRFLSNRHGRRVNKRGGCLLVRITKLWDINLSKIVMFCSRVLRGIFGFRAPFRNLPIASHQSNSLYSKPCRDTFVLQRLCLYLIWVL
jgi:hypothetical protein